MQATNLLVANSTSHQLSTSRLLLRWTKTQNFYTAAKALSATSANKYKRAALPPEEIPVPENVSYSFLFLSLHWAILQNIDSLLMTTLLHHQLQDVWDRWRVSSCPLIRGMILYWFAKEVAECILWLRPVVFFFIESTVVTENKLIFTRKRFNHKIISHFLHYHNVIPPCIFNMKIMLWIKLFCTLCSDFADLRAYPSDLSRWTNSAWTNRRNLFCEVLVSAMDRWL